jgi:hypothetical protein
VVIALRSLEETAIIERIARLEAQLPQADAAFCGPGRRRRPVLAASAQSSS